jgi:hypothetical protein
MVVHNVLTIAATKDTLFALRGDGAVFVLMQRGALQADLSPIVDPYWAVCPAVPGTVAAIEQEG